MGSWPQDEHDAFVQRKRQARMASVDAMAPELRALVHEYGLPIVTTCLQFKVTKPRHIRHLVETVLNSFSPTRGSYAIQGVRTQIAPEPSEEPSP